MSFITPTVEELLKIEQDRKTEIQAIIKELIVIDESIDKLTA